MASFLVTDVKKGVTSNSKNYLTIVFQDATGSDGGQALGL
jgi:23S rRNA maturation-related 3'-5' exoribonuclease YhaM